MKCTSGEQSWLRLQISSGCLRGQSGAGKIDRNGLHKMQKSVGKQHLVLDLSCRKRGDIYYIVTDRWQKYTEVVLNEENMNYFAGFCDEFLIHAVDVEGKASGIEGELVSMLGDWGRLPITYAGGVHNFEDLKILKELGKNKVNVTIGSALNLFGGSMDFDKVLDYIRE